MSESMRVDLAVAGGGVVDEFRQAAAAMTVMAEVQERLTGESALGAWSAYAAVVERVQRAWEGASRAAQEVAAKTPEGPVAQVQQSQSRAKTRAISDGVPVGAEQRTAHLEKLLAEKQEAPESERADLEAALLRARIAREQQRKLLFVGPPEPEPVQEVKRTITRGPREKLEDVQGELGRDDLSTDRREDLLRQRFLLRRQVVLDERRREREDESLHGPGLLEAFASLQGLIKSALSGDVLGVGRSIGRGIELIRSGDLNIEQKVARAEASRATVAAQGVAATGVQAAAGAAANPAVATGGQVAASLAAGKAVTTGTGAVTAAGGAAAAGAAGGAAATGVVLAALVPLLVVVGVVAVALLGVKLFTDAVRGAAERLREFQQAATLSGGDAGEVSRLRAAGFSGDQITAIGARIRNQISALGGNPFGIGAGQRAGLGSVLPSEHGGSQDDARIFETVLNRLRELRPATGDAAAAEYQLLEARRLGATELLEVANASDQVWLAMRRDAQAVEQLFSGQHSEAARELTLQQQRLSANWELLKTSISTPFVKDLADQIGGLANAARDAAKWVSENKNVLEALKWAHNPVGSAAAAAAAAVKKRLGVGDEPAKQHQTAMEANTAAVRENSRILKEGFLLGGERAQRAIPSGLRREALRYALEDGTLRNTAVVL